MKTVVCGPRPPELDEVIARRHALGQDRHDEVWEGDYHMAPAPRSSHGVVVAQLLAAVHDVVEQRGLIATDAFNLGSTDDYRVPDIGLHRSIADDVFVGTAALVVEVVSAGDESWQKFDHYAAHRVDEVVIADPARRQVWWFALDGDRYRPVERSVVLGVAVAEVAAAVRWPGAG